MLQATPGYSVTARPLALARWLHLVTALIVAMVVVGGITRLTESGLSITQWKPISGIVPPLNDAQWQAEFANYRRIPEYQQLNRGMTLDGFKAIFFWEYLHRLLGRVIGLAFALPLLWFWARRRVPPGYGWRLVALLALGGLQGAIGWWMVASGLSLRTDVSHIRLAVHLTTALVILAGIVWTARDLSVLAHNPLARPAPLRAGAAAALLLLFAQIVLGAFTAGLDAGYAFSSWPLMGDAWFPANVPMLAPAWTTDWMSEEARAKLEGYGIAPPGPRPAGDVVPLTLTVRCPQCGSPDTRESSRFGSTACKSLWVCQACKEPFDHFKAI